MLKPIPADEVDLDGKALEVRYKEDPGRPGLLTVNVVAHATEGGPDHVRRSELTLVVIGGRMTRDLMRERVMAEARQRAIERVAWIKEA